MTPRHLVRAAAVTALSFVPMAYIADAAGAATPVGSCTSSYKPYTYDQLAFDADAQAIFSVLDTNKNGLLCFKPYPNGPHAGHAGNLVDDKSGPHA